MFKNQTHEYLLSRAKALGEAKMAKRVAAAAVANFLHRANSAITPARRKVTEALDFFGPRHLAYQDACSRLSRIEITAKAADEALSQKTAVYRTTRSNGEAGAAAFQQWVAANNAQAAASGELQAVQSEAQVLYGEAHPAAEELWRSQVAWKTLIEETRPSAALVNGALATALAKLDEAQRILNDAQMIEEQAGRLWESGLVAWQQADEVVVDKEREYRTLLERTSLAGAIASGASKSSFQSVRATHQSPVRMSWPPGSSSKQVPTTQHPDPSPTSAPQRRQQDFVTSPLQPMSERSLGKRRAEVTVRTEDGQPLPFVHPPQQHSQSAPMVAAERGPTLAQWGFVNSSAEQYAFPSQWATTPQRPKRQPAGTPRKAKASVRPDDDPDSPSPFAFNMAPLSSQQLPAVSKKSHWRALGRETEGAPSEVSAAAPHSVPLAVAPRPHSQAPPPSIPAQPPSVGIPAQAAPSKHGHWRALGRAAGVAETEVGQPQPQYTQPPLQAQPPHTRQPPPQTQPPPRTQPPSVPAPSDLYTFTPLVRSPAPPPPPNVSSKRQQLRALGKGAGEADSPTAPAPSSAATTSRSNQQPTTPQQAASTSQQTSSSPSTTVGSVPPGATTQRRYRRLAKAAEKDFEFAVPALPVRAQPGPSNQAATAATGEQQAAAFPTPQLDELALAQWHQYASRGGHAYVPAAPQGGVPPSSQVPASMMPPPASPEMLAAAQPYGSMDPMGLFDASDPAQRRAAGTGHQQVTAPSGEQAASAALQRGMAMLAQSGVAAWAQPASTAPPGPLPAEQSGMVSPVQPDAPARVQPAATAPPDPRPVWQGGMVQPVESHAPAQVQPGMVSPVASDAQAWVQPTVMAQPNQQQVWHGGMAASAQSASTAQPAPNQQPVWQGVMATPARTDVQTWVQPATTPQPQQQPGRRRRKSKPTPGASDAPAWAQPGATAPPTQQPVWQGGMVNHPQPGTPTTPHDQQLVWQGGLATPVESVPTPQPTATEAPGQQVVWQGGMPTPTSVEANAHQWVQAAATAPHGMPTPVESAPQQWVQPAVTAAPGPSNSVQSNTGAWVQTAASAPHNQQSVWQPTATPVQPTATAPPVQQPVWQSGMVNPAQSNDQGMAQPAPAAPPTQQSAWLGPAQKWPQEWMQQQSAPTATEEWRHPAPTATPSAEPSYPAPPPVPSAAYVAARVAERGVYSMPLPPRGLQAPPPQQDMIIDLVSPEASSAGMPSPPVPTKSKSRRSKRAPAPPYEVAETQPAAPAPGLVSVPTPARSSSSLSAGPVAQLVPPAPVQEGFIDTRLLFTGPPPRRPPTRMFSGFPSPGERQPVGRGVVARMPGDEEAEEAEEDSQADEDPFGALGSLFPDADDDFWRGVVGS